MKLLNLFKKIPQEIWYILLLFITSRIVLTIIGVVSRILLEPFHGKEYVWVYSKYLWLDIWGVWDSGWYLNVAQNGYPPYFDPAVFSNWGFFPLYPLLMRIFGSIIRSEFVAGIVISNICLIVTAIFLYKLVRIDSDKQTAFDSVKYLFVFPTAFILSGVFTESLFLLLAVICFYYSKKQEWWKAGIAGFFLSLTRFWGILIILPVLYEYLETKNFKFDKIKKNVLWLALIPLGLITFSVYSFYKAGNYLAYLFVQNKAWGHGIANPFTSIIQAITASDLTVLFGALFAITVLLLILIFRKKLAPSYWLFSLILIAATLSINPDFTSLPRYLVVIFPLFIIFAKLAKNRSLDTAMTICLCLLQGFLMVFWANGFRLVI